MPIPNYQTYMRPLLEELADGVEKKLPELVSAISGKFEFTPDQLAARIPSGKQTYIYHRISWAKTYLVKAALIAQPKRGVCGITERGLQALKNKKEINNEYLVDFKEFQSFKYQNNSIKNPPEQVVIDPSTSEKTPQETIESAFEIINSALAIDILQAIINASPLFFENLVVDLMLAMGYGGSRKDAGQATQYTQDGGIDGVIKEDKLGLEMIYLQAKRYTDKTVGRPEIQAFAGALDMHRAKKGVFITTSNFSKEAFQFTSLIEKRIVLINGEQLTELMLEHNLGVSTKQVFKIKNLDSDYFSEE
ncbi:MAG: restriction system protein [Oleiphilaceae bacterium]|jgi:restriction system protein